MTLAWSTAVAVAVAKGELFSTVHGCYFQSCLQTVEPRWLTPDSTGHSE